jgi:hypothetical protein
LSLLTLASADALKARFVGGAFHSSVVLKYSAPGSPLARAVMFQCKPLACAPLSLENPAFIVFALLVLMWRD